MLLLMEEGSSDSTSRQSLGMSKIMCLHVDNQHGGSTIKDDSLEDHSPHYLLFKQESHG